MDYLGWELERQRAALWALLGGGRAEDGEAPGEEDTAWEGKALPGGRRRSPAGSGTARGNAVPQSAGRYAAKEGTEAGGPLVGAPGAWETVLAAEKALRPAGEAGAWETPVGPWEGIFGAEAEFPARKGGGTGAGFSPRKDGGTEVRAFAASRQREEAQGPAGEGTGSRTALEGPSARREAGTGETAARRTAEAAETAAGGRRAGEAGPASLRKSGGDAGGVSIPPRRDGAGTARLGGGGLDGAPGRETRLSRPLPWGEGWESPALRAEDGARALSKAVQRDARRYDGGFTIY
ncbi:MAG: hypothetical protein HFF95_00130 [Oscillibacter sp.]|nr:hypothetical protein [Oscillibacter sp.]